MPYYAIVMNSQQRTSPIWFAPACFHVDLEHHVVAFSELSQFLGQNHHVSAVELPPGSGEANQPLLMVFDFIIWELQSHYQRV